MDAQEQSDARLERYAAAMYEAANPGFRWIDLQEGLPDHDVWLDEAKAAIVLADQEQDQLRTDHQGALAILAEEIMEMSAEKREGRRVHEIQKKLLGNLKDRNTELENAITWFTRCLSCAKHLDAAVSEILDGEQ